jgi:hypothetical protein
VVRKSTGKPTKAQALRFEKLKRLGCIACKKEQTHSPTPDIHHLNLGGRAGQKRRGHDFTIPLCVWHHAGRRFRDDVSPLAFRLIYGPSLAKQSKLFREIYGTDDELLAETNKLIGADS